MPHGPKNSTVRCFYIFCFFIALLLTTHYNALLYGYLAYPIYGNQINDLRQLLKSDINILLHPKYQDVFTVNSSRHSNKEVLDKFEKCAPVEDCIRKVSKGKYATVADSFIFDYHSSKYPMVNERSIFHLFPIRQYFISAVARKGFPLMSRLDSIIGRMQDFGFIELISRQFQVWVDLKYLKEEKEITHFLRIGMEHIIAPIYVCLGLIFLASVVFVLEIVWYKYFNT